MSFVYNGSSSYTSLGSLSVFDSGGVFSLHFFFKFSTTGGEQKLITVGGHGSPPYSLFNLTIMPGLGLRMEAGDPFLYSDTSSALATDTWHSCGMVWSGTSMRVWVNGTLVTNRTYNNPAWNNSVATLGRNGGVSEYYLNGAEAEFAIWSVALSDLEMLALFQGVSPRRIRPQSRFIYLPAVRDPIAEKGNSVTNTNVTIGSHTRIYK